MCPSSISGELKNRFFFEKRNHRLVLLLLPTLCFLFLLLFCAAVDSSEAATGGSLDLDKNGVYTSIEFIDSAITTFREKMETYSDKIYLYADRLFDLLFVIQFIWSILLLVLQENCTLGMVIITATRQIIVGMFFWWLLFDRSILKTIVASFSAMANQGGVDFGELLSKQWALVSTIWGMASLTDGSLIIGIITCVVLCFVVSMAVGQLAVTYLENIVAGTLGYILMGFGGSEWTRSFALSYVRALVAIGFKLFLVTIILAIGIQAFDTLVGSAKQVAATVTSPYGKDDDMRTQNVIKTVVSSARTTSENGSFSELCFSIITAAFLFHALIQTVPSITSTLLAGATLGAGMGTGILRSFAGTGSVLNAGVGTAIGAGSVALGSGRGAAQGARSATQAASEAYSMSSAPVKTAASAIAGAAGALGGAILGAGRTAGYEVARDLGSPTFRGSRSQRLFESVANKINPQKDAGGVDPEKDTGGTITPPPMTPAGNATGNSSKGVEKNADSQEKKNQILTNSDFDFTGKKS
jgi:type IV secretion system protein TrbL